MKEANPNFSTVSAWPSAIIRASHFGGQLAQGKRALNSAHAHELFAEHFDEVTAFGRQFFAEPTGAFEASVVAAALSGFLTAVLSAQ